MDLPLVPLRLDGEQVVDSTAAQRPRLLHKIFGYIAGRAATGEDRLASLRCQGGPVFQLLPDRGPAERCAERARPPRRPTNSGDASESSAAAYPGDLCRGGDPTRPGSGFGGGRRNVLTFTNVPGRWRATSWGRKPLPRSCGVQPAVADHLPDGLHVFRSQREKQPEGHIALQRQPGLGGIWWGSMGRGDHMEPELRSFVQHLAERPGSA